MRTYRGLGTSTGTEVLVYAGDLDPRPLNPRVDLFPGLPAGFGWGYLGRAPTRLAIALLADVLTFAPHVDGGMADAFMHQVVARLPLLKWTVDGVNVLYWIKNMAR